MIDFRINLSPKSDTSGIKEIFSLLPVTQQFFAAEQVEFLVWGDPIFQDDFMNILKKNPTVEIIINHIYGHYYFALLNIANGDIYIGNSLFGILPMYYSQTADNLTISNDQFMCADNSAALNYNKRFLLENILFNYPLFNQSCLSGTFLLPTNHYIKIFNRKIQILKHTSIEDLFIVAPKSGRKSDEDVAQQFIQSVKKYLPAEPYVSALTGGLDGRTLAACSLFFKKTFSTYSFGTVDSEDVRIALKLSSLAGINFHDIRLNEEYIENFSLPEGLSFIENAGGIASFSRAHYQYAAKQLAKRYRYLITGNFGSEIFRAAHIAGAVISPNLYRLLQSKDYNEGIYKIENSPEWQWLERSSFTEAWESLREEIKTLACFNPYYSKMSKNQQFYKIMFDEIFRKYFGGEIVNQYKYLMNRTPFLDIDFLKAILATRWAGVHSDFFTENPFKRLKGQVIYAQIINRTYRSFGEQMLDKGYKPSDVLSLKGKIIIAFSWLNKKIVKKQLKADPFAVNASFRRNKEFWQALYFDPSIFNEKRIMKALSNGMQMGSLGNALSQSWFYNQKFRSNSPFTN